MKKIKEHTYGNHIYMMMELSGRIEEIDVYAGTNGTWDIYRTTGDDDPERREQIIKAFNKLY